MFNLGAGELMVLGLLAFTFLGPRKLPEIFRSLRTWTRSDWVLVVAAFASGALALALLSVPRR